MVLEMHKTHDSRAAVRLPVKNNCSNKLIFTPIRNSSTNIVPFVLEDIHDKQAVGGTELGTILCNTYAFISDSGVSVLQ